MSPRSPGGRRCWHAPRSPLSCKQTRGVPVTDPRRDCNSPRPPDPGIRQAAEQDRGDGPKTGAYALARGALDDPPSLPRAIRPPNGRTSRGPWTPTSAPSVTPPRPPTGVGADTPSPWVPASWASSWTPTTSSPRWRRASVAAASLEQYPVLKGDVVNEQFDLSSAPTG